MASPAAVLAGCTLHLPPGMRAACLQLAGTAVSMARGAVRRVRGTASQAETFARTSAAINRARADDRGARTGRRRTGQLLDDLEYDDSESPAIGLAPAGGAWADVQDHVKIAHHPLLVLLPVSQHYVGAYWAGTELAVADDLGPDEDLALLEFRAVLRDRGEA
jgi:hypothetical protein